MNIAILFGGKSAEYEVSLVSATNIINTLDRAQYTPVLIGISKQGEWFFNPSYPTAGVNLTDNDYFAGAEQVYLSGKADVVSMQSNRVLAHFDAAFPIVHGTYGEDGTLQGILKAADVPYVGPDVLGSAIAMDKDIAKTLFKAAGIPVARSYTLYKYSAGQPSFSEVAEALKLPLFVKPANAGSSVGVSRVSTEAEYRAALAEAFKYDNKILVEEGVVGKELECAVLGNEEQQASVVGEIVATKDFYSYDAKYISSTGANLRIPADIDADTSERIRQLAVRACHAIHCEGLSRVDFLLSHDGHLVLNEINTLPGFTSISMYPKLWEYAGLPEKELITRLITLAVERYERDARLSIEVKK